MIKLAASHLEEMKLHSERDYPYECCGLLIGMIEDNGRTRIVREIFPVSNGREEEARHHRMLIEPADYLRAERQYLNQGLGVIGNYHSHPDYPAVPSQFDLAHAPWPTLSYIVVAVSEGRAGELRSWEIAEDRAIFIEEEIMKGS